MKRIYCLRSLLAIAILCNALAPCCAEGWSAVLRGSGTLGANRRVLTSYPEGAGYYAVEGIFDMPLIKVPHQGSQSTTDRTNWYGSKPTLYLGCRQDGTSTGGNAAEVDAGLQWEDAVTYVDGNGNVQTLPNSQGWSIFVRYTNTPRNGSSFFSARNSTGGPYRVSAGAQKIKLRWMVPSDGTVAGYPGFLEVLAMDALGNALPTPSQPLGDPNPTGFAHLPGSGRIWADRSSYGASRASLFYHRGGMRVKRVVGITQDDTHPTDNRNHLTFPSLADIGGSSNGVDATNVYEEDGAYMRKSRFSGGQVAIQAATAGVTWIPWSQAYMQQDPIVDDDGTEGAKTGWFPDGLDKSIRTPFVRSGDGEIIGGGQTIGHARLARNIIDFPELQSNGTPRDSETYVQRYNEELAEINLQRHRFTSGVIIRPGVNNY